MSEYLNNRELATILWCVIAVIISLTSAKVREPVKSILSQLFILKFNVVYILMIGYVTLMLMVLSKLNIWDATQTKLTIIWFATTGIPNIFKINSFKEKRTSFKGLVLTSFKVVTILDLIISVYIFGIFAEIFLIPVIAIISVLIAYCEVNPEKIEYKPAYKFLNMMINIIVFFILSHAIYGLFANPDYVLTKQTIFDLLLPVLLTTMFIPFLYCLMVYSIYETIFIRVDRFIKDRSLNKKAKLRAIMLFGFRTNLLERWQKYIIHNNINSYDKMNDSFKKYCE